MSDPLDKIFHSFLSGFVKNGKVDLNQAFSEVNRRASAIGCETFDCSFARFKDLATECGEIKESGVREAITILQGEMQGYYKNARREDYGLNVKGPGHYNVADVKIPINWGKGNDNLKVAAERMGGKIVKQRLRMKGLGKIPLHVVDLRKLSPNEKVEYKENVISAIGHSKDLVFLNEETKN